jgi:hypothetical protein
MDTPAALSRAGSISVSESETETGIETEIVIVIGIETGIGTETGIEMKIAAKAGRESDECNDDLAKDGQRLLRLRLLGNKKGHFL